MAISAKKGRFYDPSQNRSFLRHEGAARSTSGLGSAPDLLDGISDTRFEIHEAGAGARVEIPSLRLGDVKYIYCWAPILTYVRGDG